MEVRQKTVANRDVLNCGVISSALEFSFSTVCTSLAVLPLIVQVFGHWVVAQ